MATIIQETNAQILPLNLPLNCQTITGAQSRQHGLLEPFLLWRGRLVKENFNVTKTIYYCQPYLHIMCLYSVCYIDV